MPPPGGRRTSLLKGDGNPFKDDPDLKRQLLDLKDITNKAEFNGWRFSFLTRFDSFLDAQGSERAEDAYMEFSGKVAGLVTVVHQIEDMIERESITERDATVKGRHCLEELKKHCIIASDALAHLLPGSGQSDDAAKRGYTNYHMGAILIGDGFSLYGYLQTCDQILQHRRHAVLTEVADKQILAEVDNYHKKLKIFCDVMADLGLYDAMMTAKEIAEREGDMDDDLATIMEECEDEMEKGFDETESESTDENSIEEDEGPRIFPTSVPLPISPSIPPPQPRPSVSVTAPAPAPNPAVAAPAPTPPVIASAPAPPPKVDESSSTPPTKNSKPKTKRKSKYSDDWDEPDLPKTAKPTAKMVLPGQARRGSMPEPRGGGRGSMTTPSRGKTVDSLPSKRQSAKTPTRGKTSDALPSKRQSAPLVTASRPVNPEKAVSRKGEPQPYGLEKGGDDGKNDPPLSLQRESQPYGMGDGQSNNENDPPVPLQREPQPYGMSTSSKSEAAARSVSPEATSKVGILDHIMQQAKQEGIGGRKKKKRRGGRRPPPKSVKLPGSGSDERGRGVGRRLSAEEAKEKPMPKIEVKRASTTMSSGIKIVPQKGGSKPSSGGGEGDPRVSRDRESQPYGMSLPSADTGDLSTPLKRERQSHGMSSPSNDDGDSDPPISLRRESQPYGMTSAIDDGGKNSSTPVSSQSKPQPYKMANPSPSKCLDASAGGGNSQFSASKPKPTAGAGKPKAKPKAKLPGSGDRGRGVGKKLSAEEAKEKPLPKVTVPKRSSTAPGMIRKVPDEAERARRKKEAEAQEKAAREAQAREDEERKHKEEAERAEAEARAKKKAEERAAAEQKRLEEAAAQREMEERMRKEEAARKAAEEQRKQELAAKREAEEKAKKEKAKKEAELRAKAAQEAKEREEAERKRKEEAAKKEEEERKRREEAKREEERRRKEAAAKAEAEAKAKKEEEERAAAEQKLKEAEAARKELEEGERKMAATKAAAEQRKREEEAARREAEERARKEQARKEAEARARAAQEAKERELAERKKKEEAAAREAAERKAKEEAQLKAAEQRREEERQKEEEERQREEENRRQQEEQSQVQSTDASVDASADDPKGRIAEMKRQQEALKAAAAAAMPKLKQMKAPTIRKKDDQKPKIEISTERKRKCYMWYARLGQPNRESMIQSVLKLSKSCDITVEEVEALPWSCGGALLPVREMNELFLYG